MENFQNYPSIITIYQTFILLSMAQLECKLTFDDRQSYLNQNNADKISYIVKNLLFAYPKTKVHAAVRYKTMQLISTFVFATLIVQLLYFINLKFQVSGHFLWLYSLVCVGPGQKDSNS